MAASWEEEVDVMEAKEEEWGFLDESSTAPALAVKDFLS